VYLLSGEGGPGPWLDPHAWAAGAAPDGGAAWGTVRGTLSVELRATTVGVFDARGRIYRAVPDAETGAFEALVPAGTCMVVVMGADPFGRDVYAASWRCATPWGDTLLAPVDGGGVTDLGTLALEGTSLRGPDPYASHDADGDGVVDAVDPDCDNDGMVNALDPDVLGDGFADAFQQQDPDADGIPRYLDADNDADGLPDPVSPGAPVDTDRDGFLDAYDLDADNDGYSDAEERAAGSSPYLFFDRPGQLLGYCNGDGLVDAADIQWVVNTALSLFEYSVEADFDRSGEVDAADIQHVINRVLGLY